MYKVLLTGILLGVAILVQGQNFQYQGRVTDAETGEPLLGALVTIKGTTTGSRTDYDGYFQVDWKEEKAVLEVSYLGFAKTEVEAERGATISIALKSAYRLDEVVIKGTRAGKYTPVTYSNVNQEEIENQNYGQDLTYLLRWTPSLVATSDAGAGVGYTGVRVRGSDATRINVTINGIPVNDSESHGVFWVNMPDLASSINNIQVQRGVGTSTNGAAAFGATVNLETNFPPAESFAEVNNSFGSFNTRKHTVIYNTGLIDDKWSFEGRLSRINSDGYIDRASANLKSFYLSGGYYGDNTVIKALAFGGKEITYQSWYGTPQARIENDEAGMLEVAANNGFSQAQTDNLLNSGRTYNFYEYDNQVDNYQQDHYQLHLSQKLGASLTGNVSFHWTVGQGFFEEFKDDEDLEDYKISPITIGGTTIESTDLIRRRWLDNDFYGLTYTFDYVINSNSNLLVGGGYNTYKGDHFGEVIWARNAGDSDIRHQYYFSDATKNDFNVFTKLNYGVSDKLNLFADLQLRTIDYVTAGDDNDGQLIDVDENYAFFNPKVGATYQFSPTTQAYVSFAVGNREPVRSDFTDNPTDNIPEAESLNNLELGFRKVESDFTYSVNYFYMGYENQLIVTGELNDVGANIRTNVPDSYRTGIELQAGVALADPLLLNVNATFSQNRIKNFTEVLYDYGAAFDEFNIVENNFTDTDIAFSPSVVSGAQLIYTPVKNFNVALLSKYVSKQYLDNTSNEDRVIDAYFVSDLRFDYSFTTDVIKEVRLGLLVNNLFGQEYVSNGYTFGYSGGPDFNVRENYFYPQALTNFMASLSLRF